MTMMTQLQGLLSAQFGAAYKPDYFQESTRLAGEIPEFDSMAVLGILTAIEETFGIDIPDDELTADTFETVGTVLQFVKAQTDHVG